MNSTFRIEIRKTKVGWWKRLQGVKQEFYFNLVSNANGQVIATSETYTQKHNAMKTIRNNFPTLQAQQMVKDFTID